MLGSDRLVLGMTKLRVAIDALPRMQCADAALDTGLDAGPELPRKSQFRMHWLARGGAFSYGRSFAREHKEQSNDGSQR